MVSGRAFIKCPFCGKISVPVFYKPSYLQAKVSRISAGSKVTYYRVPESYEIQGGCTNCGKSKKEIQDYYDGKPLKKESHEEKIKRLKKAGLPLVIETPVKR